MLWTTWLDVMILHQGWYAQVHPLKASPPRWGSLLQYAVQNQINDSQLIKFFFSQYNTGRRKQQWGALNVHFIETASSSQSRNASINATRDEVGILL